MTKVPDDVVALIRRELWEIYRKSDLADESHRDISWETIDECRNDNALAVLIFDTADAEARVAAQIAYDAGYKAAEKKIEDDVNSAINALCERARGD